jgi:hypothetical protein
MSNVLPIESNRLVFNVRSFNVDGETKFDTFAANVVLGLRRPKCNNAIGCCPTVRIFITCDANSWKIIGSTFTNNRVVYGIILPLIPVNNDIRYLFEHADIFVKLVFLRSFRTRAVDETRTANRE